jgi:hypothetical protein
MGPLFLLCNAQVTGHRLQISTQTSKGKREAKVAYATGISSFSKCTSKNKNKRAKGVQKDSKLI